MMFDFDREDIFYLFQLIAEASRQLSLRNPDYVLKVISSPVNDLKLEAVDLRTGNRYRYSVSNFVVRYDKIPINIMTETIASDMCNALNHHRVTGK